MRRVLIAMSIIVVLIVVSGAALMRMNTLSILSAFLPIPSHEDMYPQAPPMPAIVATPVEDLLSQYESFLRAKTPAAFSALQPGLTDSQIDALEMKYTLKLPADLRALYRWHNGTPRSANIDTFPNHEFVPFDIALANREELRKQAKEATGAQRMAYSTFAGHRDPWVSVIVDMAGDGHFFDPNRSESQGSFFFCFAEDGNYVFYPAFRNYLAAVVVGAKAGVFVPARTGVDTADFTKAQELWNRYGAQRPQ